MNEARRAGWSVPLVLVFAADGRIAAAAGGFLEPAGIDVIAVDPARPEEMFEAIRQHPAALSGGRDRDAKVCALVDWSLTMPAGGHLGLALREGRPGLRLIALVDAGVTRASPGGWDAQVHLPLARDALMQAIEAG